MYNHPSHCQGDNGQLGRESTETVWINFGATFFCWMITYHGRGSSSKDPTPSWQVILTCDIELDLEQL
jgi:hypothetical protein